MALSWHASFHLLLSVIHLALFIYFFLPLTMARGVCDGEIDFYSNFLAISPGRATSLLGVLLSYSWPCPVPFIPLSCPGSLSGCLTHGEQHVSIHFICGFFLACMHTVTSFRHVLFLCYSLSFISFMLPFFSLLTFSLPPFQAPSQ